MKKLKKFWYALTVLFWYRLLILAVKKLACSRGACANRYMYWGKVGPLDIDLTIRDRREEDGYAREELYEMLRLIRRYEREQNWKCPEPTDERIGCSGH